MTERYSVYQHWDPLKVCLVGKSYAPEFYSFIKNTKVRTVFEQIAQETEEDYQKLIKLLESFGVEVLRPDVSDNWQECLEWNSDKIMIPPMTPRDYSISLGSNLFFSTYCNDLHHNLDSAKKLIETNTLNIHPNNVWMYRWKNALEKIIPNFEKFYTGITPPDFSNFSSAMISRIGKDIYCGTMEPEFTHRNLNILREQLPEYRWHTTETGGHLDGTYCPVVPGLIISLMDIPTYEKTFPGWEVLYLPGQSWSKVKSFLDLKEKNKGKWWVPGQELNDDFTNFVEEWLGHWVGYVEETVFDVNMLVIDEKNVVCNNYNEEVFKAFDRYGVTPHVINFRHRYFWDGGLHCITSDIHREGTMKDYFPERREI